MTKWFCECNSWCDKQFEMPVEKFQQVLLHGWRVIAPGCPNGPEPDEIEVEITTEYLIYKAVKDDPVK